MAEDRESPTSGLNSSKQPEQRGIRGAIDAIARGREERRNAQTYPQVRQLTRSLNRKEALNNMFGSGRSEQGTIGQRPELFQGEKAQLQEQLSIENEQRRREIARDQNVQDIMADTAAQAAADLAATEDVLARQEQEREFERGQEAKDIRAREAAQLEALRESGIDRQLLQRAFDREQRGEDLQADERAALEALERYGIDRQVLQAGMEREQRELDMRMESRVALENFIENDGQLETLKREIQRHQNNLDTIEGQAAALTALQQSGLESMRLTALRQRLDRGEDIRADLAAELAAFQESGQFLESLRAGVARREAFADTLAAADAQLQAFVQSGAQLSQAMNEQEIQNTLTTLQEAKPEELRIMRENLIATAREMGMAENLNYQEMLEFFVGEARAARGRGDHDLAAAFQTRIGVGMTSNFADRLFGRMR